MLIGNCFLAAEPPVGVFLSIQRPGLAVFSFQEGIGLGIVYDLAGLPIVF